MTCRRRRISEAVPKRFRIRLEKLRPTELLAGRISLEQQARLLDLIWSRPCGNFLLMGRSGCGKTQLLHSMYLSEAESSQYGDTLVIADARDVVSDLRDFEFNQGRVRPPMLSPSLVRECTRARKRISIFLDEFHKGGTHTDWAIGVLHELIDTIYQVYDSGYVRFCAATNLLRAEFIGQLGGSLYRRIEEKGYPLDSGNAHIWCLVLALPQSVALTALKSHIIGGKRQMERPSDFRRHSKVLTLSRSESGRRINRWQYNGDSNATTCRC